MYAVPTWGSPVGEGATRSRTVPGRPSPGVSRVVAGVVVGVGAVSVVSLMVGPA